MGGSAGASGAGGRGGTGGASGTAGSSGALPASDSFTGTTLDSSWTVFRPELADISVGNGALSIATHPFALWYQSNQGELVYKLVTGDFKVTTIIHARKVSNPQATPDQYADVAGIMARNPTLSGGNENYVLTVHGYAEQNQLAIEHKSTTNGASDFGEMMWPNGDAELRLCRVGGTFTAYARAPGTTTWSAPTYTFSRADLPATLQVGMCAYNDAAAPDFLAIFDSFTFQAVGVGCTAD
jgi:hypothetical protein